MTSAIEVLHLCSPNRAVAEKTIQLAQIVEIIVAAREGKFGAMPGPNTYNWWKIKIVI